MLHQLRQLASLLLSLPILAASAGAQLPEDGLVRRPELLTATSSASSEGPAGGAALAVDGDHATRWESAHGVDPSWIVLDLGAPFALSETRIHW